MLLGAQQVDRATRLEVLRAAPAQKPPVEIGPGHPTVKATLRALVDLARELGMNSHPGELEQPLAQLALRVAAFEEHAPGVGVRAGLTVDAPIYVDGRRLERNVGRQMKRPARLQNAPDLGHRLGIPVVGDVRQP